MSEEVLRRVQHVFGVRRGEQIYLETLEQLGVETLERVTDEKRFADVLVRRGGLYEMVGRTLRVRALLRGAERGTSSIPPA